MKKFKTMMAMMLALVSMCVAFSSCSDDDDNDSKGTAAAEYVVGTYVSNLDMTVMGQTETYENATIKLEKVDDNTINVVLPEVGSGAMALPSITVPSLKVTGANGSYAFSVEGYKGSVDVNGTTKEYTITLSGAFVNGKLTLTYSLQYGKMPAAMVGSFIANK